MTDKKTVAVVLDEDLHGELKKRAARDRVSVSSYLRSLLARVFSGRAL